ncbi:uncharacterized protein LOC113232467 [Hyposmocoma kahamanoa]|uniref:uncharacterized protein LOC113232467 n=1 Tax=Hyposmocoma kahamanoa TaxID=1477025 RepID=UPI000E6D81C1|nr:uncharacterized protein LOC113232467 [Hyposmocoma kahamanoa]
MTMTTSSTLGSPIPLSEIESVLAWVDTFKLSRPTKKINRDFADAVLLAEILSVNYPKLVEMHNYPPRNSHALKLNNWMTLNRKVLKKLKLNLCAHTMEQLANSVPGVIERVLVMVRDKIKRDEEAEKANKEGEQNMSSGGSYYEACGDDEHVLVVPVKMRVNGVLETVQQKVVNYEAYTNIKQELKDSKETAEMLRQKVGHLDDLIKLKDERINELQKQLDRKQLRRKDSEGVVSNSNSTSNLPFEVLPSPIIDLIPNNASSKQIIKRSDSKQLDIKKSDDKQFDIKQSDSKQFDIKQSDSKQFDIKQSDSTKFDIKLSDSKQFVIKQSDSKLLANKQSDIKQFDIKQSDSKQFDIKQSDSKQNDIELTDIKQIDFKQIDIIKLVDSKPIEEGKEYKDFKEIIETFEIKEETKDIKDSKLPSLKNSRSKLFSKASYHQIQSKLAMDVDDMTIDIDRIKSDVFKEVENTPDIEGVQDEVFKDSEPGIITEVQIGMPSLPTTIEDAIQKEVIELCKPIERSMDNYMN